MNKVLAVVIVAAFVAGIVSISAVTDQFADAGPTKKVHFTQTIESSQDLGRGYENHQMALILSPNEGTLYDGSITFVSSKPVRLAVLHEISPEEARGQQTWTVDGSTFYGLSLVGPESESASVEFTGAAIGLHSADSETFTSTVSVDGWIRGQPTEVVMQRLEYEKEEPELMLSRAHVPVTIPMHGGLYQGGNVSYIITDSSDLMYSDEITARQNWNVTHAPLLADVPEEALQQMYVFRNGMEGEGIFGYQKEIFSAAPGQPEYSSLSMLVEITWKYGQNQEIFENHNQIIEAKNAQRIDFEETGVILNTPHIVWPDGQMQVRSNSTIHDGMEYEGGQVTEIDEEKMTVTFVAHRGWGPDGQTAYHIVTGATPAGPAETIGAVPLQNAMVGNVTGEMFQFKNGIKGSGQLGFQAGIASVVSDDDGYVPVWRIHLVEWSGDATPKILATIPDVDYTEEQEEVTVILARPTNSEYVINAPMVDPFQSLNG